MSNSATKKPDSLLTKQSKCTDSEPTTLNVLSASTSSKRPVKKRIALGGCSTSTGASVIETPSLPFTERATDLAYEYGMHHEKCKQLQRDIRAVLAAFEAYDRFKESL